MGETGFRSKGIETISAERQRQIEVEGWTAEHDRQHMPGDLVAAARCYTIYAWWQLNQGLTGWTEEMVEYMVEDLWPWDASWWKPSADPIRNMIKAGALIAAEIDRTKAEETAKTTP